MLIAAPPGPRTSTRGDGAHLLLWREDYSVYLRNRPRGRLHRDAWVVGRSAGAETVRIHQGSETMVVAAALGRLRAEDERMAGDSEAALVR